MPADRIESGGRERRGRSVVEKKKYRREKVGGELFTEAVIADEAGPSKRHGKRFY